MGVGLTAGMGDCSGAADSIGVGVTGAGASGGGDGGTVWARPADAVSTAPPTRAIANNTRNYLVILSGASYSLSS